MGDVNYFLTFGAGFLSFISPCCLPLYPAFLSYITGVSMDDVKTEKLLLQKRSLFHTLCFLLGFSVIFIALGYGTSFVGSLFRDYHDAIRQIGALLIILFGFITLGVFRPEAMMKERRIHFKHKTKRVFRFRLNWNGICGGMDAMYRSDISCCYYTCKHKSRLSGAVHGVICTRFCCSVSFIVFLYHKAEVDKKEPAFDHESRRRFDDCDWCVVIL